MPDKKDHPGFFIWTIIVFVGCISLFPTWDLLVHALLAVACGIVVSRTGLATKFPFSLVLYIPTVLKWILFGSIAIAILLYLL